jgi:hypothetical protein
MIKSKLAKVWAGFPDLSPRVHYLFDVDAEDTDIFQRLVRFVSFNVFNKRTDIHSLCDPTKHSVLVI